MAGQAILRVWPVVKPIEQQEPESASALHGPRGLVVAVDLKEMNCIGCTGPAGPLALKRGPTTAVAAKWTLGDFVFLGKGSTTPINIAGKKSAFETCHNLLIARRGLLTVEQFSALDRQLKSLLAEDDDNLETTEISVSPTSLDGLIEFLARHRPDSHPNIALTREGRFTASWSRGKRAKITLIFDREGGDWVGVDLDSQPTARASGAFVINSLAGIAQPFRTWIKA
jgi:hypothetical protein